MPEKLTREELELAAYHRFAGGCTWEQAAEKIHVSVKTLRAWRKKPLWLVVTDKIIADLHASRAAAKARYLARHSTDEPLADPEEIAVHVALPAYLEARVMLIEETPTRQERWRKTVAACIANCDRGPLQPGDRGKLSAEV